MNLTDPSWYKKITITMPALQWLSVLGNTSLGLKHSSHKDHSRQTTAGFLMKLEGLLIDENLISLDDISELHNIRTKFF